MENSKLLKLISFFFLATYGQYVFSNVIWPALVVAEGVSSGIVVAISVAIEALLFYLVLKNVSIPKAFAISVVGNIASTLVGTIIMSLSMILWHVAFDRLLGGTFNVYSIVATYVIMCIGSSVIELLTIKKVFHYSVQQLLIPVLTGNLLTYILAAIFQHHAEIAVILGL